MAEWETDRHWRIGASVAGLPFGSGFAPMVQPCAHGSDGFRHLPMQHGHAIRAGSYPLHHRDPFDRMLPAQSDLEGVPLVTVDPAFENFPIQVVW